MEKIGLIAGNGRFPILVAEEIIKSGQEVVTVALKEEADPEIEKYSSKISWISAGQFQKLIDYFHDQSVTKAIMAGQVKHARLFSGLKLDVRAIKLLGSTINKKADSILGSVANELKKENIELLASNLYLKKLMPEKGILSGSKPKREVSEDIDFGYKIAKQIAGLDIGQTIVVKNKTVIAVEAMEGTDECILRAKEFGKNNLVVIKVAKPNQDFRFDIPVIGPKTIYTMFKANAATLVIDSNGALLIDREELIKGANENNITIIAL